MRSPTSNVGRANTSGPLYVMFWYENVGPTKLIEDIG